MVFREIETEIYGLAKALKQFAEALHAETAETLLHEADLEVRDGVGTILTSCQRTINDLESLVDRCQVIKKHRTVGGFAIERSWSDSILANYRTVMWTAGGGTLENLRELLQLHTSSVTLLEQALQRSVKICARGFVTDYEQPVPVPTRKFRCAHGRSNQWRISYRR
jgi:hypothetical protein